MQIDEPPARGSIGQTIYYLIVGRFFYSIIFILFRDYFYFDFVVHNIFFVFTFVNDCILIENFHRSKYKKMYTDCKSVARHADTFPSNRVV